MGAPALVLVAPGLLGPVRGGLSGNAPRAPALARLLARADRTGRPHGAAADPARAVLEAFGCPPGAEGIAAACAAAEPVGEAGAWLRADPVHLRADHDRLLLFHARSAGLAPEEAEPLAEAAAEAFAPLGARLRVAAPARWYLALARPARIRTLPPWAVAGRDVAPGLPEGPDAGAWRRALTEAQMLLHAHEVNAAREARGLPPVNAVWLWGEGEAPRPRRRPEAVWAGEPLAAGLARAAGTEARPLPGDFGAWVGAASFSAGVHVVVAGEEGAWHAAYGDEAAWRGWVEGMERAWLAPALAALGRGTLAGLELHAGEGRCWRLTRGGLRRFWRRARGLERWLAPGGE